MICNNSNAAGGGINKLTFNPADIKISDDGWDQYMSRYYFTFSGLTKDKLGKGYIVGVFRAYNSGHWALLYISQDGSSKAVTSGTMVTVSTAYNPNVGTVSFAATGGSAQGFAFRQD